MEFVVAVVVLTLIVAVTVSRRKESRRAPDESEDVTGGTSDRHSVGDVEEESVELSEEESNRQAGQVQRIHILCQLAECHLDDLTDDYESSMLSERIQKAAGMAREIDDPLYYGAAIHPIVSLAYRAGWESTARELLETVSDSYMNKKIAEDIFHGNT